MSSRNEARSVMTAKVSMATGGNLSGKQLFSYQSLNEWERGLRLPSAENLRATLTVLGLSDEVIDVWEEVRQKIDAAETSTEKRALQKYTVRLGELAEQMAKLNKEEMRLRKDLEAEKEKVKQLWMQLRQAKSAAANFENEALDVRRELDSKVSSYEARLEAAQARIEDLQYQLGATSGARQQIEKIYPALEVARTDAITAAQVTQKYEELKRLFAEYEAEQIAKREKNIVNENAAVVLDVVDSDFGTEMFASISCVWYCEECNIGGKVTRVVCPQCGGIARKNSSKRIPVTLQEEPAYDYVIRAGRVGYWDDLTKPPGRVDIKVIPSRWTFLDDL